jgi:hypothetical protein
VGGIPYPRPWAGATPVRASDADRERAVRSLRGHYAAGRLDVEELEPRIERAWAARSRAELAALFRDLPSNRFAHGRRAFVRFNRKAFRVHAAGYTLANGALIGIWALVGSGEFWPAQALVPSTFAISWHAGGTYLLGRSDRRDRRGPPHA